MRNYTYILNEGFSKYFNKLNEEADNDELDIESTDKTLDEAVPRDLMGRIKNTRRYKSGQRYGYGNDSIDYESANMQEITAADVMKMKKRGEDLSDIYVLSDDGNLIELDTEGHPRDSGSTYFERANQSLKKTLENAVKIYKGKIGYFSETQPDKWAERASDADRRRANKKLGNERPSRWDKDGIEEFRQRLEGPAKEISAIRKEYEDGDISRKEMEARIAELKDGYKNRDISYYADRYNRIKQDRADARYYDSNKASRKNMDAYEEAKNDLDWAKYKLKDNEEKLAKAQAGEGYGNRRVSELKRMIATLKYDLQRFEQELAENPAQKELANLQTNIDEATQKIKNNQAIIDKLLHRNKNESLKRKSGKKLNEGFNKDRLKSLLTDEEAVNRYIENFSTEFSFEVKNPIINTELKQIEVVDSIEINFEPFSRYDIDDYAAHSMLEDYGEYIEDKINAMSDVECDFVDLAEYGDDYAVFEIRWSLNESFKKKSNKR